MVKQSATPKDKVAKISISSSTNPEMSTRGGFPIVSLGASAGGLEAFEVFFKAMSPDSGIAFVLIAHLDPTHVSLLPELMQKRSKMKVQQIEDNMRVEPNNVYVIPPNKNLEIINGHLQLMNLPKPRGANLPIDTFFRSLAKDQGTNAVCIILSGTGTDGTLGLKAIKGEVGMVMVQDEASAKYDGMPRSAIATGLADYILDPGKMPEQLIRYTRHARSNITVDEKFREDKAPGDLQKIFVLLRNQTGHDFSLYKRNTIYRRIERRMNVHQIDGLDEYVRYLEDSDREVNILFKELLIGVTNFFRDPAAFEFLKESVIPDLLRQKPNDYTFRIWVTGCSSGEEAYSLAIIMQECMSVMKRRVNVQIFGTDIDQDAINLARAGIYPTSIEADVSEKRLKLFFSREPDGQYRINRTIREMLVFAPQDVIKDPPFTKLDILSCRNLLIYLGSELQKKLLPLFHYSLKPEGVLFLGSSETIGQHTDLFTVAEKKCKVFRRSAHRDGSRPVLDFPSALSTVDSTEVAMSSSVRKAEEISALQLVQTILQQSNTPPCAIIDDAGDIVYIHGRIGEFLEPSEGKISINIVEMARPGIRAGLASAIRKVAISKQEVILRDLQVEEKKDMITIDISVKPILQQFVSRGLMMVIFEEKASLVPKPGDHRRSRIKPVQFKTNAELEQELLYTRENLQTTIEELETSNEELKSTNEELQSTNEELQSTNEEMETSKEELQSLNEESITVNTELQSRIDELSNANDDMKNLLDSTEIATIFLDIDLCIRRFTPKATQIIPLAVADSGRPIKHFATSLIDVDISEYGSHVLEDLVVREVEVASQDGLIYVMKVRPYRTIGNTIDGVVITFENVTIRQRAELSMQESELRYRTLFELASDPMVLFNADTLSIQEYNEKAYEELNYSNEEFRLLKISDIESARNEDELRVHIEEIIKSGGKTYDSCVKRKDGTVSDATIRAKAIIIGDKKSVLCTWSLKGS
ncbi:MAG: two-component system CheB/CheR fusion protein [Oceanicoccus sp.]|jgi:two-component system CheB/CheR fusion protein